MHRLCCCWALAAALAAATPEVAFEVAIDGDGDDRFVAVAPLGDSGAVAVGSHGGSAPDDAKAIGATHEGWSYPSAVIVASDATGTTTGRVHFAPGLLLPTAVAAGEEGIYIGGYASPGMVAVVEGHQGLGIEPSFAQRELETWCPPEHHSEPRVKEATDQRGVPCVLRFDRDLQAITAATFLEGWQSAWHIPRPLREDAIQPLHLAIASDGDVIVSHDGGYNLMTEDREPNPLEAFYAVGDHLSRLAPDLDERRWHATFHTPAVDPAKVLEYQRASDHFTMMWGSPEIDDWAHPFLGNPRVLRMRLDSEDRIWCAGWSPTRTSGEPWWSPFLLRFDPADGSITRRLYNPDPMSGGKDRMGGLVSDAAVRSVALTPGDDLLVSVIGDGGNSVVRRDPRDYARKVGGWRGTLGPFHGRHLFWGGFARLAEEDGAFVYGHYVGRAVGPRTRRDGTPMQQDMWIVDLAATDDGGAIAVGRHHGPLATTANAWATAKAARGRGGFLHRYDADGRRTFSTSLGRLRPFELRVAGDRAWIAGERHGEDGRAAVVLAVDLGGSKAEG